MPGHPLPQNVTSITQMAAKTTATKKIQTPAVFTCIFHQFNISR